MTDDEFTLFMVRLRLRADRLMELGRQRRLPLRDVDEGYLVHCQLGELFGELAPSPLSITAKRGRHLTVLAYSGHDEATLRNRADTFADPSVHSTLDWKSFASKPMPRDWQNGRWIGFGVKACPVVRMASDGPKHRKGAEVDAFLAETFRVNDSTVSVDRQHVYCEWLKGQLERQGGARPTNIKIESYRRIRLLRPTHRKSPRTRIVERPEVTFWGKLQVTDGRLFSKLLQRGVGRHRAFGFGMLLLRPPGEN